MSVQTRYFICVASLIYFFGCQAVKQNDAQTQSRDLGFNSPNIPTIVFPVNFAAPILTGNLAHNGTVKIFYAHSRGQAFPNCTSGGKFSAGITPEWSVDGGPNLNQGDGSVSSFGTQTVRGEDYSVITVKLPDQGNSLSIWFIMANRYGQCGIDSNNSRNYHFNLRRT